MQPHNGEKRTKRGRIVLALGVATLALVAAGGVGATIIGSTGAALTLVGDNGEKTQLNLLPAPSIGANEFFSVSSNDALTTGACLGTLNVKVRKCARSNYNGVLVHLNDLDDVLTANVPGLSIEAHGGSGNDAITTGGGQDSLNGGNGNDLLASGSNDDTLSGGNGNDTLSGNSGDDELSGGSGNDVLDGGTGADVVSGGSGTDTATYAARTTSVFVSLNGLADDGAPGEDDNVLAENATGGAGNDTIVGSSAVNLLRGKAGNDTITPGEGEDTVEAGAGSDVIEARDGERDIIHCGSGNDLVRADQGVDQLNADCEVVDFG